MSKTKQKAFIRELSNSVTKSICEQIDAGKIPDNWDGHELRALLAFRHNASADMSLVVSNKRSQRAKEYNNVVLTRNL